MNRRFAIRLKKLPTVLINIVDDDDIVCDEICPICEKQGIISRLHPESEEHKGSPSFKPWTFTPELLRRLADHLGKGLVK